MELEELNRMFEELSHINEKQEKRVRFHETRAQHLTIAYLVFQGVVLISITHQSSSQQCKNWWVPFTISLLSSIIYFMAFLDAVTMFYRTQYYLDLNYMEQQIIYKQIHEAKSHAIQIGESSSEKRPNNEILRPDEFQLFKRKVYITMTILALIAFTVTMLFACWSFLCDGDSPLEVSPASLSSPA